MSYWDGDRWLKGPELYVWLVRRVPDNLRKNLARQMNHWKHGKLADLYYLEPHLCRWGIHPCEIPEECWSAEAPDFGKGARRRALNPQLPGVPPILQPTLSGIALRSEGNIKSPRKRRNASGAGHGGRSSMPISDPSAQGASRTDQGAR